MRWAAFVGLAIATVAGIWFFGTFAPNTGDSSAATARGEPLIVAVTYGDIETVVAVAGSLQLVEPVAVKTPASGELAELYVGVGDRVEPGQLLGLVERASPPRYTEIVAPAAGTVSAINVEVGARLRQSDESVTIIELTESSRLQLVAELFEADLAAIDLATEVYFSSPGSPGRLPGTLRQILPSGQVTQTAAPFRAFIDVANEAGAFNLPMEVQVFFVTNRLQRVLTVPIGALISLSPVNDQNRAAVDFMASDGSTERRQILLGAKDRINAQVLSGLAEGDRVVAGRLLGEIGLPPFPFAPPAIRD